LRNAISVFFSIVFLLLIAAPSLVLVVEDVIDISLIVDINEEENTEKESKINLEIEVYHKQNVSSTFAENECNSASDYYVRFYGKQYKKLHSPPPEQV